MQKVSVVEELKMNAIEARQPSGENDDFDVDVRINTQPGGGPRAEFTGSCVSCTNCCPTEGEGSACTNCCGTGGEGSACTNCCATRHC
jgi:hypothetical protein